MRQEMELFKKSLLNLLDVIQSRKFVNDPPVIYLEGGTDHQPFILTATDPAFAAFLKRGRFVNFSHF